MNLDDVAGELYALPPAEFTAARQARVRQARSSGDRGLATAIGGLRRATTSAWIVNLLTRTRPDLIDELLEFATELRQAQTALAGEELRRLSGRRHQVVSALVDEGRRLAVEHRHSATAQVDNDLTATFHAVLADHDAAESVRGGRLTAALEYSGFGMIPVPGDAQPAASRTEKAPATTALDSARSRLDQLKQALARADEAVTAAQRLRQDAAERIEQSERQLAQARDDERAAAKDVRTREKDRDRAGRAEQAGRRRVEQAQRSLEGQP